VAHWDADLAPSGLALRDSGAWPPYSFAPALDAVAPSDGDRPAPVGS
jgi:hypothetical protein